MNDHIDPDSVEELISIVRVFSNKSNSWIPALIDKASHDIDPVWVAGVLFMILDRYVSCVSDEQQILFQEHCMTIFEKMAKEGGEEYVYRIDSAENS
jgi:hypothetical protein